MITITPITRMVVSTSPVFSLHECIALAWALEGYLPGFGWPGSIHSSPAGRPSEKRDWEAKDSRRVSQHALSLEKYSCFCDLDGLLRIPYQATRTQRTALCDERGLTIMRS